MDKYFENKINYKLKRFTSSSDNGYIDALRIYTSCISREEKTSTNEITYWLDHSNEKSDLTELMFFGFFSNDTIIGYAEIAYIRTERLIIMDYMVIDSKYMSNSSFSTFFFLLLGYFVKNDIDYDYIVTEILVKFNDTEAKVDIIRLFENEDFKVINALYIQPCLEISNLESNKEALLMIYQRNCSKLSIKKETYFRIINSIYFNHYRTWDDPFFIDEQKRNNNFIKLVSDFEMIKSSTCQEILSNEEIKLNGYKNKLIRNNALPPVSNTKSIRNALIFTFFSVILIMLILFFLKKLKMEFMTVAAVTITILFVLFSFIYLIDQKSAKILKKIPLLSKIIKVFGK
jgi:hypothetical protein